MPSSAIHNADEHLPEHLVYLLLYVDLPVATIEQYFPLELAL